MASDLKHNSAVKDLGESHITGTEIVVESGGRNTLSDPTCSEFLSDQCSATCPRKSLLPHKRKGLRMDRNLLKSGLNLIRVAHGGNEIELPVAGFSVGQVQRTVAQTLNVPSHAACFVDGVRKGTAFVLKPGHRLDFLIERGQKGTLSEEQLKALDLPPEVSLAEAAQILNCSKHTVIQYLRGGLLEWRDTASPSSSRPVFRIKLDSVLTLRNTYRKSSGVSTSRQIHLRRAVRSEIGGTQSRHIRLGERRD